jgi:hypothetical protein
MIAFVTFFDGFIVKNGDCNYYHFFRWFCCEKGGGGGVMKKVMAIGDFFFLWSFWFSSLGLTINNEMVVFFNVEGCNG